MAPVQRVISTSLIIGIVGVALGVLLWLYAKLQPGGQTSYVAVGSALFTSGVVLISTAIIIRTLTPPAPTPPEGEEAEEAQRKQPAQ
ncbi:MAG TPA: hypothetical protein EYP10_09675 [Armatimonadetes bacterium]|nr:hypothetical protein [Armatimonadota bacterium]